MQEHLCHDIGPVPLPNPATLTTVTLSAVVTAKSVNAKRLNKNLKNGLSVCGIWSMNLNITACALGVLEKKRNSDPDGAT